MSTKQNSELKINIQKRNNIKKYFSGIFGFLLALFLFKNEAKAMVFNSKNKKSQKFQIDGDDALSIDTNKNITFYGGLKDTNVTTPVNLGDNNNKSFNTSNKTIIGSANEIYNQSFPIPKLEIYGFVNKIECSSNSNHPTCTTNYPSKPGIYYKYYTRDKRFLAYTPKIFLLKKRNKSKIIRNYNNTSDTYYARSLKGFHISAYQKKNHNSEEMDRENFLNVDGNSRIVVFDLYEYEILDDIFGHTPKLILDTIQLSEWFSLHSSLNKLLPTGRRSKRQTNQYFKFCIGIKINGIRHFGPVSDTVRVGYGTRPISSTETGEKMSITIL